MPKNCEFIVVEDFEKYALHNLPKSVADYYKSGADEEQTLKENIEAFKRYRLKPRFLRDVSERSLSTSILGHTVSFPVCIAPSAMHRMAHPDGEIATVKGAAAEGVAMVLSTLSTTSLEDVAKASPESIRWFQLYIYSDREVTKKLVSRAEDAGYLALVLTVDAPVFGHRLADSRNKFTLPPHLKITLHHPASKVIMSIPEIGTANPQAGKSDNGSDLNKYVNELFDPSISWKDVHWLKQLTTLPIILKGILTAEDAVLATQNGAAGIIVSNHGARQLDGVPSTIEALPEIVKAVNGRCEVYLDGGIRKGTDVLKALALGAKAVFIGRPILWGLAYDGEAGVKKVLQILKTEFDTAMALSGCTSLHDIKPSLLVRQESYSKL
ncbi:hydroxyacid oxidase 1 [Caerostris extrusa]|uniref:(S)-2-hydroxy-acid oxidase n=1 Tax=Caerostris extrusa TaxID=172846 RepID=A0AAV4Y487_CAEEX|nr:hydroxyacid oxidase 1 [Caerostris extrusa]